MQRTNISICILLVLIISTAKAQVPIVDFDGAGVNSPSFSSLSASFLEQGENFGREGLPQPAAAGNRFVSLDVSILNVIDYGEQNGLDPAVTDSLKKLLIVGTQDEKIKFLKSPKYEFPQRLAKFGNESLGDAVRQFKTRDAQLHCWEDNCRTETVCGDKKKWSRVCEAVGAACVVAGTVITNYYTGGTWPNVSASAGAAAGLGCSWACADWTCDFDDCHEVQKCDSHCETLNGASGTDHVDLNTGQVTYN